MSNNDHRERRKVVPSMPREVQDAIDAHGHLPQPGGEVTVAKPEPGSSSYGWWMVELLPDHRAALFRPDDPESPVIWGVYVAGPEWLLSRVETESHELVGGRVYDLGGRLLRELTVEQYHLGCHNVAVERVAMTWAEHRKPRPEEFRAVLKCAGTKFVPTKEQLDWFLDGIRSGMVTPLDAATSVAELLSLGADPC